MAFAPFPVRKGIKYRKAMITARSPSLIRRILFCRIDRIFKSFYLIPIQVPAHLENRPFGMMMSIRISMMYPASI
jgi:hypothetical protein